MNTDQQQIIDQVAKKVRQKFEHESTGHDWWHINRVWQMTRHIAAAEKADSYISELGALLHDIADFKFHNNDLGVGPKAAQSLLEDLKVDAHTITRVCHIVEHVSYKGAGVASTIQSLEGKVVQDADKLDALGAIGIARAFAYGSSVGRQLHDPDHKPNAHQTFAEYVAANSPTISHFYEKLLLLKDRMNTKEGKRIAVHRHKVMEHFLAEFYHEWELKDI